MNLEQVEYSIFNNNVHFLGVTAISMVVIFFLQIFAINDLMKAIFREGSDKTLWLMIILMFPAVGAIIYLVASLRLKVDSGEDNNIL